MHHNVKTEVALASATLTATATGEIVDTSGYESLEFTVQFGTITDGTYELTVEQGDEADMSDAAAVPVENLLTDGVAVVPADSDSCKRIGSIGKKRYQRLVITVGGATTGAAGVAAQAILGTPKSAPTPE